jgi:hypothetical protein
LSTETAKKERCATDTAGEGDTPCMAFCNGDKKIKERQKDFTPETEYNYNCSSKNSRDGAFQANMSVHGLSLEIFL